MGYERNDRRDGRDDGRPGYGGQDRYRVDGDRARGDYGHASQGYDYADRGFFDRAGDEVRSWFGDEEAERRRRYDERFGAQDRHRDDRDLRDGWRGEDWRGSQSFYPGSAGFDVASQGGDYGGRGRTGGEGYGAGRPAWDNPYARPDARSDARQGQDRDRARDHHSDPSYRSWRDRQMAAYDRDYDEYRRENQSRFDRDFAAWRQVREGQRGQLGKVRAHQEVIGSDGQHVGTVDTVRGDHIVLAKSDQDSGGHHHSIPCSWIASVEDKVTIAKTAAQAHAHWKDEESNRALFGRDDAHGGPGPHILNSSFSGTY